jgi:hypothetical protein
MFRNALAAVVATFLWSATANAVCYVDSAATGAKDGSSWSNAYTSLQSALHDRTAKEIWVRRGVYKATTTTDQTISFAVALGTQLYGGFAGGESNRDARDPVANPTILSADIDSNDANVGSTNVDTGLADIHGDNSYHVVTISGASTGMIDGPTIIDGFTITGGFAKYSGFHANGGGLNCDGHGNGSGTDAVDCNPFLSHLVFSGNAAVGDGGAVYDNGLNRGASNPQFEDVSFVGNSARGNGGAICNVADNGGGASPLLSRVKFLANSAALGGAMYDRGEGAVGTVPSFSDPLLTDVMFEGNSADTGGGMYSHALAGGAADPIFHSVTFDNNRVNTASPSPYGGGLFVLSEGANSIARPQILNSTFTANQATFGGAIFHGTLSDGDVDAHILSTTISGNSAAIGGALYNGGDDEHDIVGLTNDILWGDTASSNASTAEVKNSHMNLMISSSIVETGCPKDVDTGCMDLVSGSPNLGPLQANGGFTQTMLPGSGSSAIDAGDDTLCPSPDQRGMARPQGPHCDIGSVEAVVTMLPTADSFTVVTYRDSSVSAALKPGDGNPGGPFAFSFTIVRVPADGSISLAGDTATYTPDAGFVGIDSFTYTVTDVNGTSTQAVVTIQVRASIPVAQPLSLSVAAGAPGTVTLAASDDNTGGPFTYTFAITQLPLHGSAVLSGATVTYTPNTGFAGSDSLSYTTTDVNGTSLPATVSIQVAATPPVAQPVAQPRIVTVAHNTMAVVALAATDSNAGGPFTFTFTIASMPTHGTLSLVEGSQVTYTPTHDYSGPDSFTYTVTDANGTSVPATVTLTVLSGGSGPTPPSAGVSSLPVLNTWSMIGLGGLLGGLAVRRIAR